VLVVLVIGSPKVLDTLDVVAGQTTRRNYWLPRPRYEIALDSLKALGQWPPRPDAGLIEHMRASTDVRVFRLGPPRDLAATADAGARIGNLPILGEGHRPSRHAVKGLIEALRVSSYEIEGFEQAWFCGSFSPSIDVRFTRDGVSADAVINYACFGVSLWREGRWLQDGAFKDERITEFARHAFPHDPEIRQIHAPGHRSDR